MMKTAWLIVGAAAFFAALTLGVKLANPAHAGEASEAKRTAEQETIRKLCSDFARALSKGDPSQVADLWTDQGEYISDDGTTIHGKAAIEQAYAAFLQKNGHPNVDLKIDSIDFLSQDSAAVEGDAHVRGGRPGRDPSSHFDALYVRENGQWRLARLRESPEEGATLDDLDWLIGSWVAKSGPVEVRTTYSWDENKKFILARFTIKGGEGQDVSGTQRIARDPRSDQLRSWLFGNDGDFGEATWSWDGKAWLLQATGVDADGSEVTAVNIITPLNNDTFTWQSTKRISGGAELPDIAPVKVTRVK